MTKQGIIFTTLFFVIVCFVGCSKAPSCDSDDVKDLLTNIYHEHLPATKKSAITYDGFIIEFSDDKLKKVGCKVRANFSPAIGNKSNEYVTYQAQYTNDSQIYVELKSELIAQKQWEEALDSISNDF